MDILLSPCRSTSRHDGNRQRGTNSPQRPLRDTLRLTSLKRLRLPMGYFGRLTWLSARVCSGALQIQTTHMGSVVDVPSAPQRRPAGCLIARLNDGGEIMASHEHHVWA